MATTLFGHYSPTFADRLKQAAGKRVQITTTRPAPKAPAFDPYASAEAGVQSIIDAMLAQVDREQQAARDRAQREAEQALWRSQAFAQGLQALGITGNVQKAFTDAANAQAGLAQGFSGAIREGAAEQAAIQQRALAGTGQEGAVRNQGENMGNVQYGVGGYMPSTALNTMGAAFGADAALQPGFAMQFGQLDSANRLQDWANDELPAFTRQREDIIGQRPGLYNDLLEQGMSIDDRLYNRRMTERQYADQQRTAKQTARQEQIDRQMEAIALKLAYGMTLTAKDKRLIATYGLSTQTANSLIRNKADADAAKARAELQAARDRAAMARERYKAAQRAAREAKAQAARTKLAADKARYVEALEVQKAAYRAMQEAVKAVTAASKAAGGAGKKSGGSGSASSFFGD